MHFEYVNHIESKQNSLGETSMLTAMLPLRWWSLSILILPKRRAFHQFYIQGLLKQIVYQCQIFILKHGIFQLLLWRLRDMNNFEFWRQFSAFVELIFGREGCVMILQYFRLKFFYLLLTKQNKTAGEISPTLGLWKRAPKFKIVHITKSA